MARNGNRPGKGAAHSVGEISKNATEYTTASSITTTAAQTSSPPTPIRAELSGDRRCSAEGLTVNAHAPFLAMARKLIAAGYDPHHVLEAYRGTTLCLRAQLGAAAQLTVQDGSDGPPRFRQYRPPGVAVGPPIAPNQITFPALAEALQKRAAPRQRKFECGDR